MESFPLMRSNETEKEDGTATRHSSGFFLGSLIKGSLDTQENGMHRPDGCSPCGTELAMKATSKSKWFYGRARIRHGVFFLEYGAANRSTASWYIWQIELDQRHSPCSPGTWAMTVLVLNPCCPP